MALRVSAAKPAMALCLLALTSCDAHWGDSAINSELDKAEVIGCYKSPSANPILRVTHTKIFADQSSVYEQYIYARIGKNNYPALVVRPRMAIQLTQDSPRIYSFVLYTKGTGEDFSYRVTDTLQGKVIHMSLENGQQIAFIRTNCPASASGKFRGLSLKADHPPSTQPHHPFQRHPGLEPGSRFS
ncbi:hypothetical protein [Sphingobium sp. Z007]|nr:hypothetical protein [Sphingobium sp. Z007]